MARRIVSRAVPDRERAAERLEELWNVVLEDDSIVAPPRIARIINSNQVTIRFCLPTQLLGKLIHPELDAMCLQRGDGAPGKWDPRGFATRTVVPWNRCNQNVLGTSGDPYVSNPLRRPRVDDGLDQMGDREEWENLCSVLKRVQNNPLTAERKLIEVLAAIRERLKEQDFTYVLPDRVSLAQAEALVSAFLSQRSGGDRGLAVAAAMFETVKSELNVYREVRRGVINAADAATNAAGDLECIGDNENVVLAVEVKERRISVTDIQVAVAKARRLQVRELILCTEGFNTTEKNEVELAISTAWASGTNVYQLTIGELMHSLLPILGGGGIKQFVVEVGEQLDRFNTQPRHRRAWKDIVDTL
jgi:hypothetical protein